VSKSVCERMRRSVIFQCVGRLVSFRNYSSSTPAILLARSPGKQLTSYPHLPLMVVSSSVAPLQALGVSYRTPWRGWFVLLGECSTKKLWQNWKIENEKRRTKNSVFVFGSLQQKIVRLGKYHTGLFLTGIVFQYYILREDPKKGRGGRLHSSESSPHHLKPPKVSHCTPSKYNYSALPRSIITL
jgi:hypothetical protein